MLNNNRIITNSFSENRSDLTICRMTECSASVTGGNEIMLFCDKVSKDAKDTYGRGWKWKKKKKP